MEYNMKLENIIKHLKPNSKISKNEYENIVYQLNPDCSQDAIYWQLRTLQEKGVIYKTGRSLYTVCDNTRNKCTYDYFPSNTLIEIVTLIEKEFPLVDFQVWEFTQLNEFVNHLIAKNVFFIEVENMLEGAIFNMLSEHYTKVLFCPNEDTFFTYFQKDMIVVQKLISEAPKPLAGTKCSCLEKLLVDLFSSKLTGQLIQRAEYPLVYEEAFSKFYIDEKKMFRYARRRNLEIKIKKFIKDETFIHLHTEDENAEQ